MGAAFARSIASLRFGLVAPIRTGSGSVNNSQITRRVEPIGEIKAATGWGMFLEGDKTILDCAVVSQVRENPVEEQLPAL